MALDLDKIKKELIMDEGYSLKVYKDSLGELTVGIGHLVTAYDKLNLGDKITKEKVDLFFKDDLNRAIRGCKSIYNFDKYHPVVQEVLVNMCFNLGTFGLKKFVKFLTAIEKKDYKKASHEMAKSKWFDQVKGRALRLQDKIKGLYKNEVPA